MHCLGIRDGAANYNAYHEGPNFDDIRIINKAYGCLGEHCALSQSSKNIVVDRCLSSSTRCRNGGYPNPRMCQKCICPEGLGGDDCRGVEEGVCGAAATRGSIIEVPITCRHTIVGERLGETRMA